MDGALERALFRVGVGVRAAGPALVSPSRVFLARLRQRDGVERV